MEYLRFIDKCSREFELGYEISFRDCFDNGLVDSGSKVHLLACPLIIPTPKSPNDTRTTSTLTCNSKFEVRSFFTISVLFLVPSSLTYGLSYFVEHRGTSGLGSGITPARLVILSIYY